MTLLALLGTTAVGAGAAAQEPERERETAVVRPAASTSGAETQIAAPPHPPLERAPREVIVPGRGPSRDRDSVGAGTLKGVQAVEIKPGEARLVLAGGQRTVRPGDLIGSDVVKSVEPGRIVLARPLAGGSQATVVVTFDGSGHGRVRVYYDKDPTAVLPPAVR